MISLKRAMEDQVSELLTTLLGSFKSALSAIGESGARACPPAAEGLVGTLSHLQEQLSSTSSPDQIKETGTLCEGELKAWSTRASGYYQRKSDEIKEIMALVARAAEQTGVRDKRNAGRFQEFTAQLRGIGDLEDLTRVRQALADQTTHLGDYVDQMVREGQQSAEQLRKQLSLYESRLQEAEQLASRDPLTGLDNRRRFEQELEYRVARGTPFCVLMIDLNRFKAINDQYGHLSGDEILKQFSQELRAQFRYPDIIARWGGDEFAAVLDSNLGGAETCAKRIFQWVFGDYTVPTPEGVKKIRVDGSVGIAEWLPGEAASEVLSRADATMYAQKKSAGQGGGGLNRPTGARA
jgi:diguanylate cyclase (GGDEF)-like protein